MNYNIRSYMPIITIQNNANDNETLKYLLTLSCMGQILFGLLHVRQPII